MSDNGQKIIKVPAGIGVRDLAERMEASPIDVIKILMTNGVMASINQQIDFDSAAIVAADMGFEAILETEEDDEAEVVADVALWRQKIADEDDASLEDRPPVVTILGHVDHGKTTLLDAIRQTDVQAGEAGGITQHIGAYQVEQDGKTITFLDTPGHAAFTAMRARGAQGADIVVLVVAADDGVMPQTKEAIAHAKAANVPIIVALNKIDKSNANLELVKKQLSENELVPDEWDGDTIVVPVSATKKEGIEDLLEAILLVADNMDIRANPAGDVVGTVIEAELDKARGVVATLLIQNGTLKQGDIVVAGGAYGRLRAIFDYRNNRVDEASPSTPAFVMGLNEVPSAGEVFEIVEAEKIARFRVKQYAEDQKSAKRTKKSTSLEDLFAAYQAGEAKELRLIIKADVQGSLAPIVGEMNKLGEGEIGIKILYAETGNIGENDITLAAASDAIVIGFNVQAEVTARRLADNTGVSIRLYNIIYRIVEDVEKALKGMLDPVFAEKSLGKAEVLAVFPISKLGKIAGCRVRDGVIRRNAQMRLKRGEDILFEGEVSSLKQEKDRVNEVRNGFECGIGLQNFHDIEVGDILECYIIEKEAIT
ncbi:MAG: translation initiation factor IF-2 [Anaerolineales bacterium]|uniref:Translation initiation factor IF-2 n=1 Tax=Candidatus Desulfolinea nitratireducens TaxID=2841698 RepID=A0A8J6TK84_9CHLR|nr:translation initiation factor IF-2 [Candidatus Desulfolinea nitratireducens]MBL6961646.1 translation initiation factor IF-2 [Anaerolineales bacterium]